MSPDELIKVTNSSFEDVVKLDKDAVTKNIDINYEIEYNPMKEDSKYDSDSFIT